MSASSLITDLATTAEVPVVVTRTADNAFTAPLIECANAVIQCELTTFGPRFAGEDFETLVYPLADGTFQTTLAYWQRVLTARHPTFTSATIRGEHPWDELSGRIAILCEQWRSGGRIIGGYSGATIRQRSTGCLNTHGHTPMQAGCRIIRRSKRRSSCLLCWNSSC
ncbi:hypothetical protein [Halocatena marina]|uniref:hypothetical protein n=1 Tax=Halocatena marina TaxID=2934937 RepID=UPI0036F22410